MQAVPERYRDLVDLLDVYRALNRGRVIDLATAIGSISPDRPQISRAHWELFDRDIYLASLLRNDQVPAASQQQSMIEDALASQIAAGVVYLRAVLSAGEQAGAADRYLSPIRGTLDTLLQPCHRVMAARRGPQVFSGEKPDDQKAYRQ